MATHHIICEGEQDKAFLTALLNGRGAPFEWIIRTISSSGHHGISNLHRLLNVLVALSGFKADTQHLIVIVDADDDPARSFRDVQAHFRNSNASEDVGNYYVVPARVAVTSAGSPSTTVLLMPSAQQAGALESLLWQAVIQESEAAARCVDQLIDCSGIEREVPPWNRAKLDKARLGAAIAILNRTDPTLALRFVWERAPALLPVTCPVFDELYNQIVAIGP